MKRYLFPIIIFSIVLLTSCQKVIDVNLNGSDPRYIIEGNVTDQAGPYTVRISRSINFSDVNTFPAVTGATITIKDVTAGVIDTLKEDTSGYYRTTHLQGMPGHQYDLYIKVAGHEFTASSVMPPAVDMDSVYTERSAFGGDDLFAVPVYTDPIATGNCYLVTQTVNHVPVKDYDVRNDEIVNGKVSKFPFFYDNGDKSGNPKIAIGDSVFITLHTIDSTVFEFYRTLQDTKGQNSAALANPLTNIKGGGMGYFSAAATRVKGALVH